MLMSAESIDTFVKRVYRFGMFEASMLTNHNTARKANLQQMLMSNVFDANKQRYQSPSVAPRISYSSASHSSPPNASKHLCHHCPCIVIVILVDQRAKNSFLESPKHVALGRSLSRWIYAEI
jgi:hypothetical protein